MRGSCCWSTTGPNTGTSGAAAPTIPSCGLTHWRAKVPALFGFFHLRKKGRSPAVFRPKFCRRIARKITLWSALAQWPSLKLRAFRKRQEPTKRTGGSNLVCSSNESVRTAVSRDKCAISLRSGKVYRCRRSAGRVSLADKALCQFCLIGVQLAREAEATPL